MSFDPFRERTVGESLQDGLMKIIRELLSEILT